jgi:hypothetical protein
MIPILSNFGHTGMGDKCPGVKAARGILYMEVKI